MMHKILSGTLALVFILAGNAQAITPEQQKATRDRLSYLGQWEGEIYSKGSTATGEDPTGEYKVAANMISQAKRDCRADINSSACYNKTFTAMKKAQPLIDQLSKKGAMGGAATQMGAAQKKEATEATAKPGLMSRMKAGLNKAKVSALNTINRIRGKPQQGR